MPAWFEHLDESFPYKEFQFKKFWLSVKTSCPPDENVDGVIPRVVYMYLLNFKAETLLQSLS